MITKEIEVGNKPAWELHNGTPQEKADFVNSLSPTGPYEIYEERGSGVLLVVASEVDYDLADGPIKWNWVGFWKTPIQRRISRTRWHSKSILV